MYVRDENKYILLGSIEDITINNNLIVKELYGAAAFLVNGKQLLNITDYYMHNLSGKKYHINDGIHILTKEEVYSENEDEIKARIEKSRKEALEQKTREEALRKAMQEKEEQDRIIEENLKIKDATIQELLKNKARLEELEKKLGIVNKTRFKFSHLLIDVEGHKEINPDCFIIGLDRIDFQNMPVKNVKLSDLDLSKTNLTLGVNDFQYIYENDVSHSNLEGLYLLPNTNFDGVKMLGTSFSIDSDPKTMDINIDSFRKAIYDEDTTINGFHLVDLLDKEKRHKM